MSYRNIKVERRNKYIIAAINNPPMNALSQGVLLDLNNLLDVCINDNSVRVILITACGEKIFSVGANIKEESIGKSDKIDGNHVFLKIERYPKPIIAALQENAYGGGTELALSCHLRILSASAKLFLPEVKLGLIPGWGGTQRLPKLIGRTKALEFILTGNPISSEEALHHGLVNWVVPRDSVYAKAEEIALYLSKGAPLAMKAILKAVIWGEELSIAEGLKLEKEGWDTTSASEDAKEGESAFFDKRVPVFTGK